MSGGGCRGPGGASGGRRCPAARAADGLVDGGSGRQAAPPRASHAPGLPQRRARRAQARVGASHSAAAGSPPALPAPPAGRRVRTMAPWLASRPQRPPAAAAARPKNGPLKAGVTSGGEHAMRWCVGWGLGAGAAQQAGREAVLPIFLEGVDGMLRAGPASRSLLGPRRQRSLHHLCVDDAFSRRQTLQVASSHPT